MTNPTSAGILIVTVIYNQKITDTNVYKTLLSEKEAVYIYDNSPGPQPVDNLSENWIYISDPSNPGLSAAYNKAAEYAASNGYDWILISDQDTIYPEEALELYRMYIVKHNAPRMFIPKVKISDNIYLSPVKQRLYLARTTPTMPPDGEIELRKYAVINSGILVATDSFISCGGYNEKVFLDFSDFQFIERFENLYKRAYVTDIICQQDFSDKSDKKEKKLSRFEMFCLSLKGYECVRKNKFFIHMAVLRRAIALSVKIRSLKPIKILIRRYILRNLSKNQSNPMSGE